MDYTRKSSESLISDFEKSRPVIRFQEDVEIWRNIARGYGYLTEEVSDNYIERPTLR